MCINTFVIVCFFLSAYYSALKTASPLVLTEMSLGEGKKRKHSMISKKSKYAEVDSDEDDDSDECQY